MNSSFAEMAAGSAVRSLAAAMAAVPFMYSNPAVAEKSLADAFPFFSSSPSSSAAPTAAPPPAAAPPVPAEKEEPKPRNDNPRTTAAGFDPEALERGAKALREINTSPNSKKVFELMRKQEETRQTEEAAKRSHYEVLRAQQETERQKVLHEEQRKTMQQQAQNKAQLARYEDELARKRMQAEHEAQRQRNSELVEMQEKSAVRQETLKRQTEEQILAQRLQSEREKAEIERETIRTRAMAEAEGRAHEARLAEDVNRRLLLERANTEREKWLAAINTTFEHIGGGLRALLTDQNKLVVAVGGATALAAGIYTTREGARVIWRHIDRILGQPSLIRESSRGKYPWSRWATRLSGTLLGKGAGELIKSGKGFGGVVLHPSLHKRIQQLAAATANTKRHDAPFRNMLFYGPPGTGKTLAAKELSKQSGLDYALMTGGDVAPLGPQAVTKIHEMFDWAGKTRQGLLLFIDEADAFLCQRNNNHMTEAQRSALNALLYRTGDQSRDIVLVLATNRPSDLDSAVTDRIDEVLEFPLPGEEERAKLLKLYLQKYIAEAGTSAGGWKSLFQQKQAEIEIRGVTDDLIREAARKTEGFSGREIAKLMASMQGAVYGSRESVLDAELFREVVDFKAAEHYQRRRISADRQPSEGLNFATAA